MTRQQKLIEDGWRFGKLKKEAFRRYAEARGKDNV